MRLFLPHVAVLVCGFPAMSEAQTDSSQPRRIVVAKSLDELQRLLEMSPHVPVVVRNVDYRPFAAKPTVTLSPSLNTKGVALALRF